MREEKEFSAVRRREEMDAEALETRAAEAFGEATIQQDGKDEHSEEDFEAQGSMSLTRHLEELRVRIIRSMIAVALGTCASYSYIDEIMHYITLPAGKLYYMQPAEAFFTYLKVAIFVGFLIALPVVFYQVWRFFLPALTKTERLVLGILVPTSVLLFFIGIAFSFFIVLPVAIKFFMSFGNGELEALFSIDRYFDFTLAFILPFGFVFELPLVITVLGKLGIVTSAFLNRYQRLVIFLAFVIGAIITPTPDVFSQTMLALPMIVLYEVGYLIVRFILKK